MFAKRVYTKVAIKQAFINKCLSHLRGRLSLVMVWWWTSKALNARSAARICFNRELNSLWVSNRRGSSRGRSYCSLRPPQTKPTICPFLFSMCVFVLILPPHAAFGMLPLSMLPGRERCVVWARGAVSIVLRFTVGFPRTLREKTMLFYAGS